MLSDMDVVMCFSKRMDADVRWKKLALFPHGNGFVVLTEERLEVVENGQLAFRPLPSVEISQTAHEDRTKADQQFGMLLNEYELDGWTANPNGLGLCPF